MFPPPILAGPDVLFPTPTSIEIRMDGKLVMRAQVAGTESIAKDTKIEVVEEPAQSLFLGYPHGPKTAEFVPPGTKRKTWVIKIGGKAQGFQADVTAAPDSFACSDDPNAPLMSSFGRGSNLLANAVYDRTSDWLLTYSPNPNITLVGSGKYRVSSKTGPIEIELKMDYYRNHLGYFLWDKTKPLWNRPVAGWCSWMACLQDITEKDVRAAAQFFSTNLKDYGYNVIQIDDGYQRVPQNKDVPKLDEPFSDYWTKANAKFPSGLRSLAAEITALGMTPGIWIGDYLPLGLKNSAAYVTDKSGKPHKGPWVGYAVNALIPEAREEAYLATVKQMRRDGWRYFKIDTLRHVLYDNYRQAPDYWKARGESMETAYRTLLDETKKAVGGSYLLACWGTIPELAGIPDGCRIGEDVGPDVASMRRSAKYIAQFNYLNDVVWRNDPDYMCLRVPLPQAQAWATLTSLSGGHVMVSDKVSDYDADRVDILRKIGPPIALRAGNAASLNPDPEFLLMNARKFELWTVAARFGWGAKPAADVPATELGLDPAVTYLAFDFWDQKFLGEVKGSAPFHGLEDGACQVVSFRPIMNRPQVLGTNRHIGQGAYELDAMRWKDGVMSGTMRATPGGTWKLMIHVPTGWQVGVVTGATQEQAGQVLTLTFASAVEPVPWSVSFRKG